MAALIFDDIDEFLADAPRRSVDDLKEELALKEREIAREIAALGIELRGAVRREIPRLLRQGRLTETAAVQDWLALYSDLMEWMREDDCPLPIPRTKRVESDKAAMSGLLFFLCERYGFRGFAPKPAARPRFWITRGGFGSPPHGAVRAHDRRWQQAAGPRGGVRHRERVGRGDPDAVVVGAVRADGVGSGDARAQHGPAAVALGALPRWQPLL